MKESTGMRNHILATGSIKNAFDGMVIRLYGSPTSQAAADALVPAGADDDVSAATLLGTISLSGGGSGVNLDSTPTNGVLSKAPAETWTGTLVASGYFSFARISGTGDTGALSTTEKRFQLTVGTLNKEFIVAAAYKSASEEQRMDSFYIGVPAGS